MQLAHKKKHMEPQQKRTMLSRSTHTRSITLNGKAEPMWGRRIQHHHPRLLEDDPPSKRMGCGVAPHSTNRTDIFPSTVYFCFISFGIVKMMHIKYVE